jgi:hypothetical protein
MLVTVSLTARARSLRHPNPGSGRPRWLPGPDRPPCLIKGEQYIPVAFYAGCASAPGLADPAYAGRVALLEYPGTPRPRYARGWHRHRLPGTRVLQVVAYLPPARIR